MPINLPKTPVPIDSRRCLSLPSAARPLDHIQPWAGGPGNGPDPRTEGRCWWRATGGLVIDFRLRPVVSLPPQLVVGPASLRQRRRFTGDW